MGPIKSDFQLNVWSLKLGLVHAQACLKVNLNCFSNEAA